MINYILFWIGILIPFYFLLSFHLAGIHIFQDDQTQNKKKIIFYNVENLFHPSDDSLKDDHDFTPSGIYHWSYKRYFNKLHKLAQVLVSIGAGEKPAIIGFCEIENRRVLEDLRSKTILKSFGYKIIHQESNDARGIDVGLLYDPEVFFPENYVSIPIIGSDQKIMQTRSILKVTGLFYEKYPCHIFVNHWPSRRGGQKASEYRRIMVASQLRTQVELIFNNEKDANIIIFGDFNDEPVDKSLADILQAVDNDRESNFSEHLYNLMFQHYVKGNGTHYRKNNFIESSVLDQFIVSRSLIKGNGGITIKPIYGEIYKKNFLINEKNGMPLRTFQGLKYIGGFSDHFPIYIEIYFENDDQ